MGPFAKLAAPPAAEVEAGGSDGKAKAAPVYFLDARIEDASGAAVARNLYWLPAEDDVLDLPNSKWYVTPVKKYADLTGLQELPPARLEVTHRFESTADGEFVHVTLANPGKELAFFVELSVTGEKSGHLVAPIYWDDNYVTLLPGERRDVSATIPAHALAGERPVFHYQGINVEETTP